MSCRPVRLGGAPLSWMLTRDEQHEPKESMLDLLPQEGGGSTRSRSGSFRNRIGLGRRSSSKPNAESREGSSLSGVYTGDGSGKPSTERPPTTTATNQQHDRQAGANPNNDAGTPVRKKFRAKFEGEFGSVLHVIGNSGTAGEEATSTNTPGFVCLGAEITGRATGDCHHGDADRSAVARTVQHGDQHLSRSTQSAHIVIRGIMLLTPCGHVTGVHEVPG